MKPYECKYYSPNTNRYYRTICEFAADLQTYNGDAAILSTVRLARGTRIPTLIGAIVRPKYRFIKVDKKWKRQPIRTLARSVTRKDDWGVERVVGGHGFVGDLEEGSKKVRALFDESIKRSVEELNKDD